MAQFILKFDISFIGNSVLNVIYMMTYIHKKIGIDMGKEMLKVTLTLFADDDESSSSSNTEKGPKKKDFKNTGNKRVIILASVPKVNENYSNIKILLNLLNLKLLETYWITGKTKTME